MAQVKDLRTQNLELQRSHQELSQAVASTGGISQSYGDRITQILSTLAKFDAAAQGYRRDSKVTEASVPSREIFSVPLENLRTRPLILRTRVQSLQ